MTTIKISGMTCQHCQRAAENALSQLPGVERVEVNLAAGTANLWGTPDPAAIRAALEEEGLSLTSE